MQQETLRDGELH